MLRWDCATAFVGAHLELGDIEEAGRLVAICNELSMKIGQPYMRWVAGFKRTVQAFVAGRLDDAEAFAAAALQAGMEGGHAEAAGSHLGTARDISQCRRSGPGVVSPA